MARWDVDGWAAADGKWFKKGIHFATKLFVFGPIF